MSALIRLLETVAICLAALCVAAIMMIVSTDAIARYLLHAPLPWAFDLITYYLLIAALYFAVSATFQAGDHISLDLFRGFMPRRFRNTVDVIWSLLAAGVFALISYGAWKEMYTAYIHRQFLPGYFAWPAWASYPPIVIGAGLLVLRLLNHCYHLVVDSEDKGVEHRDVEAGEHSK